MKINFQNVSVKIMVILTKEQHRTFLVVQRLGLHALVAEGPDSIPGRGTKIPQSHAVQAEKKKKANS